MDSVWIDRIWPLMEEAFPPVERRSKAAQAALFDSGRVSLRVAVQSGKTAGFLTWWELPSCRFAEHLAVDASLRGAGLGPKLLKLACEKSKKPVVLEIEPPDSGELPRRRLNFYRRQGFFVNAFPYQQQPLNPGDKPIDLVLLSYPRALSAKEFSALKDEIYLKVYGVAPAMAAL